MPNYCANTVKNDITGQVRRVLTTEPHPTLRSGERVVRVKTFEADSYEAAQAYFDGTEVKDLLRTATDEARQAQKTAQAAIHTRDRAIANLIAGLRESHKAADGSTPVFVEQIIAKAEALRDQEN
jgi:hypothetical protein